MKVLNKATYIDRNTLEDVLNTTDIKSLSKNQVEVYTKVSYKWKIMQNYSKIEHI